MQNRWVPRAARLLGLPLPMVPGEKARALAPEALPDRGPHAGRRSPIPRHDETCRHVGGVTHLRVVLLYKVG